MQMVTVSVANPGCLSRIPDPDVYPSRIPAFWSRVQQQKWKRIGGKICFTTCFWTGKENYGFGIPDPEKPTPDPGVKKALDHGSGSATLVIVMALPRSMRLGRRRSHPPHGTCRPSPAAGPPSSTDSRHPSKRGIFKNTFFTGWHKNTYCTHVATIGITGWDCSFRVQKIYLLVKKTYFKCTVPYPL